jgi:hypothetical protein
MTVTAAIASNVPIFNIAFFEMFPSSLERKADIRLFILGSFTTNRINDYSF